MMPSMKVVLSGVRSRPDDYELELGPYTQGVVIEAGRIYPNQHDLLMLVDAASHTPIVAFVGDEWIVVERRGVVATLDDKLRYAYSKVFIQPYPVEEAPA